MSIRMVTPNHLYIYAKGTRLYIRISRRPNLPPNALYEDFTATSKRHWQQMSDSYKQAFIYKHSTGAITYTRVIVER